MFSAISWMKEKYYLNRNPFPRDAILREGSDEPSENGSIFNPGVNTKEVTEFYEKFALQPIMHRGSGFGAIWSLGFSEEARGYGKSSLGQFGCKSINKDFGKAVLMSLGMDEKEWVKNKVIASFGSFDRNNVTSFNSVAFEHAMWVSQPKYRFYDTSPLERMRNRIVGKLNKEHELKSGTEEETDAIISRVEETHVNFQGKKLGPLLSDFLTLLAENNPREIKAYLDKISVWNRMRNGFSYLDTVVTFAKAAGIKKVILFVDQVEDFANTNVSRSKRIKEVERFRDVVEETAPFSSMIYYVLTMHPLAQQVIADTWDEARLPSLGLPPPDGSNVENTTSVQVLRGVQNDKEAVELFKAYLNDEEYRIRGAPDELHPFTEEAVCLLREFNQGRPGHMLRSARSLLDIAAAKRVEILDEGLLDNILNNQGDEEQETTTKQHKDKALSKSLR